MRDSKLIKTLLLLTHKEFKNLKFFINSPFFNRNKKCIALYELLEPYAPKFEHQKLDVPSFTDSIYTNKRSLSTLINDMIRLLEEYMMQVQFKKQESMQKYFLLEELRERGGQKHFHMVYRQSLQKTKKGKNDIQRYREEYFLELSNLRMLYQYQTEQQVLATQLKKSIIAFDKYILANHLWLDNTIYNVRNMETSEEMDIITKDVISNFEPFVKMANQEPYKDEVLIQLHLLLRKLLESKKEEYFLLLFDSLKLNHSLIQGIDYFYKLMANYCIQQILQGNTSYYGQLLNIYLFTIDIGVFIEDKYLEPNRMVNVITTATKSGQTELAYELLDKYINLLNPIYQPVTEAYCRGYLHFQQKEYDSATDKLLQCLESKSLFELDAEAILYKTYYETQQNWAFDVPVQSFIIKLSRKSRKYPKDIIKSYINFFKILKQVYRKKIDPNYKKTFDSIIEKIDSLKFISDKRWLLEKIHELDG